MRSCGKCGSAIYILLSIKTRIETVKLACRLDRILVIYILLSIKTRIETNNLRVQKERHRQFISYYPLKQGLKQEINDDAIQALKIYILLSIKTRIETRRHS